MEEHKTAVYLTASDMQSIAAVCDIAVREKGIQIIRQVAPILELLDEAIQENAKLGAEEEENADG